MENGFAIKAVNLTKYYGQVLAVDHISFGVRKGEIFGFLGPNGAGKTTTVSMLVTLLTPSEGTALVNGHDIVKDAYRARQDIGVVPEMSNVYVELSAWANLIFTGELHGVSRRRREARARELLEELGLWEKRHTKASEFSMGMRKRLLIAMALVHDPAVIFLDEPTSGLDVQSGILVRAIIRRLNSDGATIFLTTHQMEEANQTCDRVAIIHHGRIACIDAPENLRQAIESVQSVLVSFAQTGDELERELVSLDGVLDMRKDGDKFRLFTKSPGTLVPQIVDLARSHNTTLVSLNTAGPSLEDVFIKITGIDVSIGEGGERNGVA
jgi:ABC-2 type transport system ATP-binding protein